MLIAAESDLPFSDLVDRQRDLARLSVARCLGVRGALGSATVSKIKGAGRNLAHREFARAGVQIEWFRVMAFRMVSSFRMQAVRADLAPENWSRRDESSS